MKIQLAPPQHDPALVEVALKALDAKHCICGRRKRELKPFCPHCIDLLVAENGGLLADLGGSVKSGYAEAYDRAKNFLKEATAQKARRA